VLDVHLNGSGFELQERLAADGLKIPIIFITAHDDDSTRRRLEKCGAVAYLWKPVDEQVLLQAIPRAIWPETARAARRALELLANRKGQNLQELAEESPAAPLLVLDLARVLQVLREDLLELGDDGRVIDDRVEFLVERERPSIPG
jgi:FixJ family two-component response regulator